MKFLFICLGLVFVPAASAQGPLAPPTTAGPQVGPVPPLNGGGNAQAGMKTLHQIEPRVAVQTLAATPPYTITASGSYYLTGNIEVATGDAIVIAADYVTLDLNGFSIKSNMTGGALGSAVLISDIRACVTVRNGTIISSTTVPPSGAPTEGGFKFGISGTDLSQGLVSAVHVSGAGTEGPAGCPERGRSLRGGELSGWYHGRSGPQLYGG